MARIRAIKPEFWSSPNLPPDPWARLLYIAMWNWADDMGVGTANPREVLGFAFPNDEEITPGGVRRMFGEIHRVFGVKFYTVAGRPYYAIPNWSKHQKFDNRSKGKHPGVDEAETWLYQEFSDDPAESAGNPSNTRRDAVAGTGEQGNRGTGEQGNTPVGGETSSPDKKEPSSFEKQVNDVTTEAYAAINKSANFMGLRGIAKWCLKDRGIDGSQFRDAVTALYGMGKPITRQTVGQFLDGHLTNRSANARESRMQANLRLVEELAAESKGIEQ